MVLLRPPQRLSVALPQRRWRGDVLRCVDLHCGGEPATVVVDGGGAQPQLIARHQLGLV